MIGWGLRYWPYFLMSGSAAFLGPEIYAAVTNVRNTLSWYCWNELHLNSATIGPVQHTMAWWLSLFGWLMFVLTITAHIWWKSPVP